MLHSKALREPGQISIAVVQLEPAAKSVLASVDLLADLDRARQIALEQAGRYRRFSAQELILERDSASTDLCVIIQGRARVVNYSLAGREISFADLSAGDYFGELSTIDSQPRCTGVVALEDSLILTLPRRMVLAVLADYPQAALKMMQRLAKNLRSANERIMDLSTLAAHDRVHAELLRQAQCHKTIANTAVIEPIPVHSDIASRVSTTRETVARVLNDLARRGVVERTRNALVIRNFRQLQTMVQDVRG
jgi:CRP/FNR family transcriptional regulator, cyclic AMP receptor protein